MRNLFQFSGGLAGLGLLLSACVHEPPGAPRNRFFLDPLVGYDSYSKVFDRKTKEDRAHSEFEPVLTAFCTNWDEEMRRAYVRERSQQYRLSKVDSENLLKEELAENQKFIVYILSIATREPEWNDIDRLKSLWRITLENRSGEVQINPERIEAVSPKDEVAHYFYKEMSTFNRTYRVRFARDKWNLASGGNADAVVHISGPRGFVGFEQKIESVAALVGTPFPESAAPEEKEIPNAKTPARGQAPR